MKIFSCFSFKEEALNLNYSVTGRRKKSFQLSVISYQLASYGGATLTVISEPPTSVGGLKY
ncbi:MAG: hypothetical protein F6K24_12430 [Okeania sp. SIO2D1]|nr:hypothetical protein [Okeania sp. SIO2D1]